MALDKQQVNNSVKATTTLREKDMEAFFKNITQVG
jgi:hypothetical protein